MKFLKSILKRQVNSSSVFVSFFIVIIHNSSVNFKLIHFLLWTKRCHKSPHFDTFECSDKNLLNSSCHFSNHKSVFLQILRYSSISWKVTPLYFFNSNSLYFAQKEPIKVKDFWDFWVLRSKFIKSLMSILKQQVNSSPNFVSLFTIMKDNSYLLF